MATTSPQKLDQVIVCPHCGHVLGTGADAIQAWSKEQALLRGDTAIFEREPILNPTLSLVVIGNGRQIPLPSGSPIYLGRADRKQSIQPDIDFSADRGALCGVSRRHARIHRTEEGFLIEDLASTNGTFLNGKRLPPSQPHPLEEGDTLNLGELRLLVTLAKPSSLS